MNDSKKKQDEPIPPFRRLQLAKQKEKQVVDLKRVMSECQLKIDSLPVADNPEGQRLKNQIATANVKLSALLGGRNPKNALHKKELKGRVEKETIIRTKSFRD